MAKNGTKHRRNTGDKGLVPQDHGGALKPPWQDGETGNSNGRPKTKPLTDELKRLLAANDYQALKALMAVGLRKALKGDYRYWQEILNRIDGKVLEQMDFTSGGRPMSSLFSQLTPATQAKVLKEAGGPED